MVEKSGNDTSRESNTSSTDLNEVLTLILANPENVPVSVWQPIFEGTGLVNMSYVPPQTPISHNDWPTLKEMLDSGGRIVVFMDKGAEDGTVPYIPQFTMMWEDEYDPTNSKFPCAFHRTAGTLPPDQQLNLINHNLNTSFFPFERGLRIPDHLDSPKTNSVHSVMTHVYHCSVLTGDRWPNFVLVDFVNVGQAVKAGCSIERFPIVIIPKPMALDCKICT